MNVAKLVVVMEKSTARLANTVRALVGLKKSLHKKMFVAMIVVSSLMMRIRNVYLSGHGQM